MPTNTLLPLWVRRKQKAWSSLTSFATWRSAGEGQPPSRSMAEVLIVVKTARCVHQQRAQRPDGLLAAQLEDGRQAREVFPGPPLLFASPAFSADQGSGTLLRSLLANFCLAEPLKGSALKSCFNQRGYRCELLMWWILKRCAQNKGPLFEIVGEGKKRDSFFYYSRRKNFATKKNSSIVVPEQRAFPSTFCNYATLLL